MLGTTSLVLACGREPKDVGLADIAAKATEPGVASALTREVPAAEPAPADPSVLRVDIPTRFEWHEVDALPANLAAVTIERAVRVDGTPYDPSFDVFGTSPHSIRRGFVLEREQWLLGEPLLVELRVEVEGPGTWTEYVGGNDQRRGRDDNFVFLLRRADGLVVPDVYTDEARKVRHADRPARAHEVTAKRALSYWLPVQRYAAITEPGIYDLYCLGFAGWGTAGWREALAAAIPEPYNRSHALAEDSNQLVERRSGEPVDLFLSPSSPRTIPDSPLAPRLPEFVAKIGATATDFAHFRVVIRQPSEAERQAMIKTWTAEAEAAKWRSPATRADAAHQAIWFARQSDFLPVLERWLDSAAPSNPFLGPGSMQDGLALRGTKAARDLLISRGDEVGIAALRLVPDTQVRATIPELIELLSDPADRVRSAAFHLLAEWTGQRFDAAWVGYDDLRPTLAEGQHLQGQFRRWWAEHRANFELGR